MPKLTVGKIKALSKPGLYGDGGTLYLNIAKGGSKSWIQRVMIDGRRRDIGLGGYPVVTLQMARDAALDNRRLIRAGGDPLAEKRKAKMPTFRAAVEKYFEANRPRWRSAKAAKAWMARIERYAFPTLGDMPVDRIGREDVLRVLSPVWSSKAETGRKVRQGIHGTLAWAQAHSYVEMNVAGEAIAAALPTMPAVQEHHRALPYQEIAEALAVVEASSSALAAKLCFRFTVLTAVRSGEARGATWGEINVEEATWTIPAERMKADREHRVPLSDAAIAVLEEARGLREKGSDLVFPAAVNARKPMKDGRLMQVLRNTGLAERASVHGFRTSFRTWAAECTNADHAVMELCLAHKVGSAVERSYARTDLFEKRRVLMQQWADYATGSPAEKVVRLHR